MGCQFDTTDKIKEERNMKKTMKIEGMMGPHCEAAVKNALESLEGVASADVSHKDGTAIVTLSSAVDGEVLLNAVEAKGYTVISID